MSDEQQVPPVGGSIVGVWVSFKKGRPVMMVETVDGKCYEAKCREVWPGRQFTQEDLDEEEMDDERQDS